jgi:hypothetical protein
VNQRVKEKDRSSAAGQEELVSSSERKPRGKDPLARGSFVGGRLVWGGGAALLALPLGSLLLLRSDPQASLWGVPSQPLYLLWFLFLLAAGWGLLQLVLPVEDDSLAADERYLRPLLLTAVLAVAAAFRFPFLTFGFPHFHHPDEGPKAENVARMLEQGSFHPHYFLHPTLLLYLSREVSAVFEWFGLPLDAVHRSLLAGRTVSATAGVLSVWFVFLIGRRLFDAETGLFAALLLAISPLHVTCSRYMKEDALCLMMILACLYFFIRGMQDGKLGDYLTAGLFAGFAAGSKYSGMLTAALFLAAPWLRSGSLLPDWKQCRISFFCLLLMPVGFLLCCPYAVLDAHDFLANFMVERNHMRQGHQGVAIDAWSQYWMYHFARSVVPGMTALCAAAAVIGMGMLLASRVPAAWLIVAAVALFYLPAEWVKAKPPPQPERYILPCVPFLCLAAAFAWERLSRRRGRIAVAAAVLLSLFSAQRTAALARDLHEDTREKMRQWIAEALPPGTSIIIDAAYSPQLGETKMNRRLIKAERHPNSFTITALKASGFEYLLVNSFAYRRYFHEPKRNELMHRRMENIFNRLTLVQEFTAPSGSYGFHNPEIRLYRIK